MEDFQVIGDYIAENTCLMHLLLDNTAAYIVGEDTPISELIEKLAFNSALRSLSICTNRIDSRAALVIEDSLEGHPMLSRLRSILRLLCRKESSMSRCKSGDEKTKSTETHTKVFSFTNPGGKYILDLGIPYDRSLCRMLYETAERFNLEHNKAFVNINHSHPPYHHPVRDSIGQYKVRREGILTFTFNVESAIAAAWSSVADDDFIGFLNSHLAMMRFEPHKRKLRPKAISGMHAEQETFLTALASDFNMEVPYLEYMVQACPEASNEILFRLIPSLKRDGCSTFLAMSLFPRVEDLLETQWRMESFLLFNPQNPTGRYKLKLENSTDFAVAQQLLLLDRWESVVNRRHNRGDVSQRGNRSQLRNELYQGRALHLSVKLLTEWAMPEFGEFECDYATSYHPKQGSKPLSDTLWESVMMAIYDSPCRPEDQLKVLKIISHQIFLSSLHIRQMVGFFRKDEDREEALVMFWPRVIDKYNAKVFRVRFEKKEDVERLGYITFFPYFQPENAVFRFNMAVYEQRVSACLFVQLMLREMPGNIKESCGGPSDEQSCAAKQAFRPGKDPTYEKPDGAAEAFKHLMIHEPSSQCGGLMGRYILDGNDCFDCSCTLDPMAMGVPRSWAALRPAMFNTDCCCQAEGNEVVEVVWSENPKFFRGTDRSSYTPLFGAVLGSNLDENPVPRTAPSESTAPVAPLHRIEARSEPSTKQWGPPVPVFDEEAEAALQPPVFSRPETPVAAWSYHDSPKEATPELPADFSTASRADTTERHAMPQEGTFLVNLQKLDGDDIGLEFDTMDSKVLLVSQVRRSGLATRWNATASEESQIRQFDRLLEVNGCGLLPSVDLVDMLQDCDADIQLRFEHPDVREFSITPDGRKLGLGLEMSKMTPSLRVRKLDPAGAVHLRCSEDNAPHMKPHDRIVQVNEESDNVARMAKQMVSREVSFKIYRYTLEMESVIQAI
ncbi:RPA1 [Symbiodinium sp. CCMP2456]|nr:RPA1 [Symbiodinium sp. CCMP2456]